MKNLDILTELAQLGNKLDPTGAVSFPIYHSATYAHPELGKSTGYDYSRTANPTRSVLESAIANLERGCKGLAFASGLAGITTVLSLFKQGDHLIVTEDLYGGTFRLFEQIYKEFGISATYVDTSDNDLITQAILPTTKAIFCETPTNPVMRIADIKGISKIARFHGLLTIVDNTFLTPFLQRPLELGADIVVHSATKYLGGHNDVVAGLVVTNSEILAERLSFLQNALGTILGPQDCWLLLRGLKTLGLRMERQQQNSIVIAAWLSNHPLVDQVFYPGLPHHPGYEVQHAQAAGPGAIISFSLKNKDDITKVLKKVKLISFAESLGGVESLITYPFIQTHADIPQETREKIGINERVLRLSVGIESIQDLLEDLNQALES
ncbi:MAG: cystathionine gamma-synthase [Gracilibacter sp. BRH_c7a]|nr:MAG: cystathionine gamma-synthase [Gracilibacter sp. BRH_c7a]